MSKVPDKKKNINTSKNSKSGGNDQGKSNKNNEGDDDNELEEPEQGCCDKFAACLIVVFKVSKIFIRIFYSMTLLSLFIQFSNLS